MAFFVRFYALTRVLFRNIMGGEIMPKGGLKMRSVEEIKRIRGMYLPGMRIKLVKMDDIQAPPVGTEGTIRGVDDIGSIQVDWDTGSHIGGLGSGAAHSAAVYPPADRVPAEV